MLGKYRYPRLVIALLLSAAMIVTFIPEQLFVYAEGPDSNVKASEDVRDGDSAGGEKAADNEDENPADQQKPDADENKAGDEDENPADQQKPGADENNDGDEPAPAAEKDEKADAGDGNTEKAKEPAKENSRSADGVKAGPLASSDEELSISSNFELNEDGTYYMSEANQKHVYVDYSVEGPNNKVLVIEVPGYGVAFDSNSLPSANNDITAVKLINSHTFAIRIKNTSSNVDLTNTFTLKSVKLTAAQAADLIDNGMQNTRIAVTEYTYEGSLDNVMSEGTKGLEKTVWEGKPYFNSSAVITATHTYKGETTPLSTAQNPMCDNMLARIGRANSNGGIAYKSGAPRFKLPEAYKENGSLVEMVSIRFYSPDKRLMLEKLLAAEAPSSGMSTRDLTSADFSAQWNGWKVTEGTVTDEEGNITNYYYDITPKSRWFNVDSFNLNAFYGGMVLKWKLRDPDDPLDVKTDYVAPNTIVTYKLPGTGELVEESIKGSEILTYDVRYRNGGTSVYHDFYTAATRSWETGSDGNHEVVIGSIHRDEAFGNIRNNSYMNLSGRIQYIPKYTGEATQTWEFPYQIQPLTLIMKEGAQHSLNSSFRSKIDSIFYTTWEDEDTSVPVASSYINSANERIKSNRANPNQPQNPLLVLSYPFPEGVHVKTITVKWNKLSTDYKWSYPWDDNYSCTIRTDFDYKVNDWTDKTETEHLSSGSWVQVRYSDSFSTPEGETVSYTPPVVNGYPSSSYRKNKQEENYLWFKLRPQVDPDFYGYSYNSYHDTTTSRNSGTIPVQPINNGTSTFGHFGFYVGQYGERRDEILNPVITLSVSQSKQSYDQYWASNSNTFNNYTRSTLDGIEENQMLAFLTGEFTAMPKLAGWTFEYTTKDHPEGLTYTVPDNIPEEGRTVKIPLEDGDCFTSLKLRYDGYADLSHDSEDDTKTVIYMMKNIKMKRLTVNPLNGEEIRVKDDYHMVGLTLIGKAAWDDCVCSNRQHDATIGNAQTNKISTASGPEPPRVLLYSTRKIRFNEKTTLNTTAVQNINQGGKTAADFTLRYEFWGIGPRTNERFDNLAAEVYSNNPFKQEGLPWGELNEAVFVEIVDDEFIPDLSTTTFMGYRADSAQVIAESVTIDGRRFLKLKLADGVVVQSKFTDKYNYGTDDNVYNQALKVGFTTLPGTSLGDHHPIGEIYFDASLLLDHYAAPEKTGYDYDRTKYIFSDKAVVDELGLSYTDVTGAKLFKSDGSVFTVHVDISLQAGADLAPGKKELTYDYGTPGDPDALRQIKYYPGEEESLNGMITLKGPGDLAAGSIYDMEAYVIVPRIGTDITWTNSETSESHIQANEELDLYMRGAAKILSNNGHLDVTVTYTTETNPTSSSEYVSASEITDWSRVTGIKVHSPEVKAQTAINLRLDLRSDAKENTDILTAYSGGSFRYKLAENGDFSRTSTLPLCAWKYDNVAVKNGGTGSVFWDVYDENGVRTVKSGSTYQAGETLIKGVKLTLYDADGTVIDTATTDNNGAFTLETYKLDAGQYIVIDKPTVSDGSVVKLTKQSAAGPINSNVDSDFDRETNKLTLGQLTSNGLTNISAGFVKLPAIVQPEDVTMEAGQTIDITVLVNEFISNTTYDTSNVLLSKYKIAFDEYDDTLVTINEPALQRNGTSNTQMKAVPTITALDKPGSTTVTVTVTNCLGDKVSRTFKININKLELHTEDYSDEYDAQSHYGVAYATLDGKTKLTDAVLEYSTDNGETWTTEAPYAKNVADSCTVLVRANYESFTQVEGSYKLTITPAPLTITAKDQTYEYNGGPQGEDGSAYASDADITKKVEAAGLKGQDELTSITLNGQETNAKEYAGKIVPSAAEVGEATDNYTIEYVAGKLTITPASATITANDKTKTYGDADPELTATEDGILEGDNINYKLKRETGENVKGSPYAITFEYEGRKSSKIFSFRPFSKSNTVTLGNYEVTFVDGELTIEPAEIIIKTPSKEKTYDGSPLTAKGSIKGLVNGETVTFTTTGKQTEVGSSENTYSLKWDGTAKKSNYTITEKLGTLTVTEAAGEDDDEEDDDTDEPGGDNPGGGNPGGGNPGGGNPVGNNPGPGGNGDGNGTIVTADNDIPDSAAPTTLIDDNAAPRAGNGSWALINLIAAILTAIGAIVALFRRKQEEDEQETDKVDENDGDEADTRGRKMLAAKLGGVFTAIVSIIVFFLTEDMTLPMILVDKWTLLMIIFFAVQILTAILNKRASKDDDDEEDDGPAPETA